MVFGCIIRALFMVKLETKHLKDILCALSLKFFSPISWAVRILS